MALRQLPADDRPIWLDTVGAFVILCLAVLFSIMSIGPYFGLVPPTDDANQKAVVNNLFIAIVSFFIGGNLASRKKDDTIGTLSTTAAKAQDALAPNREPDVILDPGQSAKIAAKEKQK